MEVQIKDIYCFLGALKSQFMNRNSKIYKARQEGKEFKPAPGNIDPDDLLLMLIEELEQTVKDLEHLPSNESVSIVLSIFKDGESKEIQGKDKDENYLQESIFEVPPF